jgi:hypothetical protein
MTEPHAIRRKALAIVVDDRRHDGCAGDQRRNTRYMINAVLKHRNAGGRAAKARQAKATPTGCPATWCKGAPNRPALPRQGPSCFQFNLYRALGALQRETFERLADAGDDIMPVGSTEAPGRDTTNAAQADHGDGETRLAVSPNTWGNRSIIHYGSVRQWPLSVKRGGLAVRSYARLPVLEVCGAVVAHERADTGGALFDDAVALARLAGHRPDPLRGRTRTTA